MDARSAQMRRNTPSPLLPAPQNNQPEVKTFIFSELPPEEKSRFMDFLITNNVEFAVDNKDHTYVATIKIVN